MSETAERVYSITSNGNTIWYTGDRIHRNNDLPAVEYANGDREWWKNGLIHRDNQPAIERVNGESEWWEHGKLKKSTKPVLSDSTLSDLELIDHPLV